MAKKRFTSSTKGLNAAVFVATPVDYSTDASLAAFINAAPVGEIIVLDGAGARHTDAITAGEKFQIVQKTSTGLKKTPLYLKSEVTVRKQSYVAPVKQVVAIGWTGAGGGLGNETLAAKQNFGIKIMETTEGYDPFPTWNFDYTTKHSDTIMDVIQALAARINDDNAPENKFNQRLVRAIVKSDATYGNYTMTGTTPTLTVTTGSKQVLLDGTTPTIDVTVGDLISFDAAAAPTDAVGDIYKIVASSATGFTLNRAYTGATQTFTEAEAEGTRVKKVTVVEEVGIQLVSIEDNAHFRVAVNEGLANADITYVTPAKKGSGMGSQVVAMEKEGKIWEGETTNMVPQPEKWGQQDTFASETETYDYVHIDYNHAHAGIAPNAEYRHRGSVIVALPKSSGNIDGTFDTLFGL